MKTQPPKTVPALASLMVATLALTGCPSPQNGDGPTPTTDPATQPATQAATQPATGAATQATQHAEAMGEAAKMQGMAQKYSKPGYKTMVSDEGRLIVLTHGEQELSGKHVTKIGAMNGMTVKANSRAALMGYLHSRPGFKVLPGQQENRLIVLAEGEEELSDKHVTKIGVLDGMTVKANDKQTLNQFLYGKPGFDIKVVEQNGRSRLHIFPEGAEHKLEAKHVTKIGVMNGMTVKANEESTLMSYLYHAPGFEIKHTQENGRDRLHVFREGEEHKLSGKHVTKIGVLNGLTVKANDKETLEAFLAAQ
jgi:hypothetical protein